MNAKIIRLDRFSSGDGPLQRLTSEDLAAAHDRGLAEGMRLAGETSLAMLAAQIEQMQSLLMLGDEQLHEMRRQSIRSLAPVLEAIVGALAPSSRAERVAHALGVELDRLADNTAPRSCTITCGPDLGQAVSGCLPQDSTHLRVVISATHEGVAEITFDGGLIRFDDSAMTDAIAGLIQNILQEI